jgi:hypothetical protein
MFAMLYTYLDQSTGVLVINDYVCRYCKTIWRTYLTVDWPTQESDVGCDYHPNTATHAAEGAVLAIAICLALGW